MTHEQIEYIRTHAATATRPVMAARLGISVRAVETNLRKLNIPRKQRNWTPEEKQRLLDMSGKMPKAEIAAELNRTISAVEEMSRILGKSVCPPPAVWSPEQMAELKSMVAAGLTGQTIADKLGRTLLAVHHRCSIAGISMRARGQRREKRPRSAPRVARAPQPKPQLTVIESRLYYCPDCHAPVSDYRAHMDRMGCIAPWLKPLARETSNERIY